MRATTLPLGAPAGATRAVIRRAVDGVEMVELRWGLRARGEKDESGLRFVRSEGRTFPSHRCLVPASDFQVVRERRPYRVSLEDENWFYLAGIWRPASQEWPEAFAVLTIDSNREIARYQARQGVVIRRNRHMAWLDHDLPEEDILQPLPPGSFLVQPTCADEQLALLL